VDEALANDTLTVPALHESPEQVRDWLATWHTTGLWLDGRLLGVVRARRVEADWHVGRLGVVPDMRVKGIGRWLLRAAEAVAEPNCRHSVLFTGAGSRYNIGLYQSEGYHHASLADTDGTTCLIKDLIP
jgi:GNAT superfamily N-acetyltransferase